jgi:iron complex outermembrane receptor protein
VAGGRLEVGLDGSYLLKKNSRLLPTSQFGASEVGVFTRSSELGLRWKHAAHVSYGMGNWTGTVRNQYSSKYAGFVPPGVANGSFVPSQWDPSSSPTRCGMPA